MRHKHYKSEFPWYCPYCKKEIKTNKDKIINGKYTNSSKKRDLLRKNST